MQENPVKLGLVAVGLADAERERALRALVAAAFAAALEMPTFKSDKKPRPEKLRAVQVFGAPLALDDVRAQALGNDIARWLTALPPNVLTAASYRAAAVTLGKAHSLTAEFFGEAKLKKLGAGAFLAVSQGNEQRDAGVLRLKYRPGKQTRPELALVGKGIIFDTGGTNLKPFKGMLDMHTDMQGSAVALGAGIALAEQIEVPFAFDIWMAITENRLSARAYKSQDVVTAADGTTDSGDPHRRRRTHGARRHARARGARGAQDHHRLRDAHGQLRCRAHRALRGRFLEPRRCVIRC